MKKLASTPLDIVDEVLQENVDRLTSIIQDLPEAVKTAHIPTMEEVEATDESKFAAVIYHPSYSFQKKYANYNKELTELNAKLFIAKEGELPDELCKVAGVNLHRALLQFDCDVPEEFSKYASDKFVDNVVDLTQVNARDYALKLEKVAGSEPEEVKLAYAIPGEEKFPVHDEYHTKKAIEFFDKHASAMDVPARAEYAKNVENACTEHAVDPSGKILKYASFDMDNYNDDTELHIKSRLKFLKPENHKYVEGLLAKRASLNPLQTCLYLEELDTTMGLNNLYGKYIDDAPTSTFDTIKEASITLKSGNHFTQTNLNDVLDNEKTAEHVDADLLHALHTEDGLRVYNSMPQELQDHLKSL
jgi:hypothetical protein